MRWIKTGHRATLAASVLLICLLIGCSVAFRADLYSILSQKVQPALVPTISPVASPSFQFDISSVPTVTLACSLAGARIMYSFDGAATLTEYTGPVPVPLPAILTEPSTIVLMAYAVHDDYADSPQVTQSYRFVTTVPSPVISPAQLPLYEYTVNSIPDVSILCVKAGATILYSLDGGGSYAAYSGAFPLPVPADTTVASAFTLTAYATLVDYLDSDVSSQVFGFIPTVPEPAITPVPSSDYAYHLPPTIAISCSLAGATVYYSIDGLIADTEYSGPFTLTVPADWSADADIVVRSHATNPGYADSLVASQPYHFVATSKSPLIAPIPAIGEYYTYDLPPTITITGAQTGATILYTVDGGSTYGTYALPFSLPVSAVLDWSVSGDITISAFARQTGFVDSLPVSVVYPFLGRGIILTVAGNGMTGYSGDGGTATAAALSTPEGVCADISGNLYISDTGNNRIRKVDASTGIISTFAGTGVAGFAGDGGQANMAMLSEPTGIAVTSSVLYVSDTGNNRIRAIDLATGIISTYAGTGVAAYSGDGGDRLLVAFNGQRGIVLDNNEKNIYVADTGNNRVRQIEFATGTVTLIAGNGAAEFSGDSGNAVLAGLNAPRGVGLRLTNKFVYIADTGNHRVRYVDPTTGIITTIAGTGVPGYSGNGGAASLAELNSPERICVDNTAVYVSDTGNSCVRKIDGGVIENIVGIGVSGFAGDFGPATLATISGPIGYFLTSAGDYLVDSGNGRIRKILEY